MTMFIDAASFATNVLNTPEVVLVDFFTPACGPCHAMEPVLRELARDYTVCKVDAWEYPDLASQYRVHAVPALLVFKAGREVARFVGAQAGRTLRNALDAA
jgi:thioredoxin